MKEATQNQPTHQTQLVGFLRAKQCAELCGIAKSTWHLWVQQKKLCGVPVPQPIKLSEGITVWTRAEVHAFLETLAQNNSAPTPPKEAA